MDNGGIRRHRMEGGSTRVFGWLPPRAAVIALLAVTVLAVVLIQLISPPGRRGSPAAAPGEAYPAEGAAPTVRSSPGQPTPTSSPLPTSGPRGITAKYEVMRSWDDGFVERITLTNHGTTQQNWTVTLVLPAGATVTKVWRADVRQSGSTFQFTRTERMAPLAAGATVWFAFEAGGRGARHQSCEVNGRPCA